MIFFINLLTDIKGFLLTRPINTYSIEYTHTQVQLNLLRVVSTKPPPPPTILSMQQADDIVFGGRKRKAP